MNVLDQFVHRVVVLFGSNEAGNDDAEMTTVEIFVEVVQDVSLDRALLVVVERVPAWEVWRGEEENDDEGVKGSRSLCSSASPERFAALNHLLTRSLTSSW